MMDQRRRDIISNLPVDITNMILVHLPLDEAVRTCVLSKKWRYKWASIPDLVFVDDCFYNYDFKLEYMHIVNIVDRVLLYHVGPIHKFCLELSAYIPFCHVDNWIIFMSRKGVREMHIQGPPSESGAVYDVPSSIFLCEEVHSLMLQLCAWTIPATASGLHNLKDLIILNVLLKVPALFAGFSRLTFLALWDVDIPHEYVGGLSELISKCPLLHRLSIIKENKEVYYESLKIHASNLSILHLGGRFGCLSFVGCPLAHVHFECSIDNGFSIKAFKHWNTIKTLKMELNFLKALCMHDIPERLSTSLSHLTNLRMQIDFANPKNIWACLCICISSPNLNELIITSSSASPSEFQEQDSWFWDEQNLDYVLNKLRYVDVLGIHGTISELEFTRYLLASTPVLSSLCAEIIPESEKTRVCVQMMQFRRASQQGNIVFDLGAGQVIFSDEIVPIR